MSGWTRDRAGAFVDWTRPPWRCGGVVNFLLPGESAQAVPPAEMRRRTTEYYRLVWHRARGRPEA